MKLFVICIKNGAPYPYGPGNGKVAAFKNYKDAEETMNAIEEYDELYCRERGGLHIESVCGPEVLLNFLFSVVYIETRK